jgi:membrane protease YdiL (CAAX protease family)
VKHRIAIPILISAAGVAFAATIVRVLLNGAIPVWIVSKNNEINFTFTMQVMVLALSLIVVGLIYLYDRKSFKIFFRIKPALRSGDESNWNALGPVLAVAFTLGTTMYMSFAVRSQHGAMNAAFWKLVPLVILFAAMNAWSEEMISRFAIVAGLHDKLNPAVICWISAVIFGLPHFFGTPSGIFGVMMSGLMGWLLAKSVLETRALGWALFIHFLQDVVIFGGGAMVLAAKAAL